MRCPNCVVEVPVQHGPCPNCGAIINPGRPESFGKRHPAVLISVALVTLAAFLMVAAIAGSVAYKLYKGGSNTQSSRRDGQTPLPSQQVRKTELAVEHGSTIRPEELHSHGKLYFVPVGAQAIPVQSLADYYLEKFGTQITVLPQVEIQASDCLPERKQCVAEELMAEMTTAYPDIASDRDSVMIALTDEDIFPRELGWRFTYSLRGEHVAIVSTRRMDPAFWGKPHDAAVRLASTKQMLTKYVALLYYRVPDSFDPTSIMYTPLDPDGGSDDLHESDLHPEATANGRRGRPYPCLFFTYSYQTHEITLAEPVLQDCWYGNPAHSGEETFETILPTGTLVQRSLDVELDSSPKIEFRRGYNTGYEVPADFGLGWNVNHSYNAWLSSDGLSQLTVMDVNGEAYRNNHLTRSDSGRGFNPRAVYQIHDYEAYGARLTWESGRYKLRYRDGSLSTFLECDSPSIHCYWIGYQDAKGNSLDFDRGPHQELRRLASHDNQGIAFQYDAQHRMTLAEATNGSRVSYEYDADGCLAKVHRSDGQVTVYTYDPGHRVTSVAVIRNNRAKPEEILSAEYDAEGRIAKLTLANIGAYKIEYLATGRDYASYLRVTDPAGQILKIGLDSNDYVVRAESIRFPAVISHR